MYDELVKRLRDKAGAFDYDGWVETASDYEKAADAIEGLQKVANKLLAKYQEEATGMIWEYSGHIDESLDHLHEEVRTIQAQIDGKPPKEET